MISVHVGQRSITVTTVTRTRLKKRVSFHYVTISPNSTPLPQRMCSQTYVHIYRTHTHTYICKWQTPMCTNMLVSVHINTRREKCHTAREEESETDASLPASWQLLTSFILNPWPAMLRVSLFITSHQLGRFQSTAYTHTQNRRIRKWKEVGGNWRGLLKTSRDGWGSQKGTNMLDLKKGKGKTLKMQRDSFIPLC